MNKTFDLVELSHFEHGPAHLFVTTLGGGGGWVAIVVGCGWRGRHMETQREGGALFC